MVKIGMLIADRYEVLEKIGTGGMSVVYKAKDHKLNRFVAVKILKQEFSDNANFVSKFRVEAQAAAGLMHPNIVNVYDVGDEKGMYYIVMELVDGITLKKYIEKKSRLSVKEAISIAIQVSMGLQAAHHNHIIHRDIKPQNIIISKDGKVKVTDFGIAKAATSNTITSNVMGSVHYTSPEQARGGYSDERSDIYSLGISMFEMLTGRVPFNGETTVAIAIKHIQTPMPSPREFIPEIPRSVEQIVLKCCEKSPDRRYQNMEELIADLKQSLIHPDDDFVKVIHPDEESATRLAAPDEQSEIRRRAYYEEADYQGRREEIPQDEPGYGEEIPPEEMDQPYDGYQDEPVYTQRPVRRRDESLGAPLRKNKAGMRYNQDDYTDDFDTDTGYDPQREKRVTFLSVLAAILIGLIIIIVAALRLGLFDTDFSGLTADSSDAGTSELTSRIESDTVTLPEMQNADAEDLKKILTGMGLTVEVKYAESDTVESDHVISAKVDGNEVSKGTKLPSDSTVALTVSTGKNGVKVPDVAGKSIAEAKSILQAKGFSVSQETDASDEVEKNSVIRQDPEAGIDAPAGSTVTITISTGPDTSEQVQVPSLLGQTQDAAVSSLTNAGLQVGNISQVESSEAAGTVVQQSIGAGKMVDPKTAVDLQVSSGPKTVTYSFSASIDQPSPSEDPNFVPGTQVYVVIIAADGTKLLDTTTSSFPLDTGTFRGLQSSTGTLQMSYTNTTEATVSTDENGNQVVVPGQAVPQQVTRTLTFTPEN
ncbi:serine/threonine protein kinase [Lachnospiraceae bacterium NK3A20]|nr:serine/threonine protein kinase [Lachnospiraceae bacterium NK3A20]